MSKTSSIIVETTVHVSVEKVWKYWITPEDIQGWNFASDDWKCPKAENDVRVGGSFVSTMSSKDGMFSFDFNGIYNEVEENKLLAYELPDGRKVRVTFESLGDTTKVTEVFDPESENPVEMQKTGWQSILNNFKKYAEGK